MSELAAQSEYYLVLKQILEIQKHAIKMSDNGINGKLKVNKESVSDLTLQSLATYFGVAVREKCQHVTSPYIRVETQHCDIIIQLKLESNDATSS